MRQTWPRLLRGFAATLLLALAWAGPALGDVSYFYDDVGRLVRVVDEAGNAARYDYDAVGNLVGIIRESNVPLTTSVSSVTPSTVRPGEVSTLQLTGANLTGASVTVGPGIVVVSVQSTPDGLAAVLFVEPSVALGAASLTISGVYGSVTVPITIGADLRITTVAGIGQVSFAGDGGPATSALLSGVDAVAADGFGNVFIADGGNNRIRKVGADGTITTVAGIGWVTFRGDGGPATSALLGSPSAVAFNSQGDLFVADTANHRIRKIAPDGTIVSVAGTGEAGDSGDGGPATGAQLYNPSGVAVDGQGSLLIADGNNNRIRKLNANGTLTTLAGTGEFGFGGDGGPATAAQLANPQALAADSQGNVFVADTYNGRIRKIGADGTMTTVAGNGTYGSGGDGGPATAASLGFPQGVAVDGQGNLFIADTGNNRIRKVTPTGTITTVAGIGAYGFGGDGGSAISAQLKRPFSVAVDGQGNLLIGDSGNSRIRKVSTTGTITTIAGSGEQLCCLGGDVRFSGDGGPATSAELAFPGGVAVDAQGDVFLADSGNNRIRKVSADGTINTVAGGFTGDGGPATDARLGYPGGIAVDGQGALLVADSWNHRVRRISTDGLITTVAGTGESGIDGDGGAAISARIQYPEALAFDSQGNLFIATSNRVRKISVDGTVATVAGTGECGLSGDGGPATSARFAHATAVAVDGQGNLFIVDSNNSRIRKVSPGGTITTFAGVGYTTGSFSSGFSCFAGGFGAAFGGDGGAATSAQLFFPQGVALDGDGNVFIADRFNGRIRRVGLDGVINTVAGGGPGPLGDGGPATSATLDSAVGVAVGSEGNFFVAEYGRDRIRKVALDGIISTLAGGFTGDGGPATSAKLKTPQGVAVDSLGNLFMADTTDARIRKVAADGTITTVVGTGDVGFGGDGGPATGAQVSPAAVAVDGQGNLWIADYNNDRIRKVSASGIITTVAGGGEEFPGDGGPATAASLYGPQAVAVDGQGNVFFTEPYNGAWVRKVAADGTITTVAGTDRYGFGGDGGPATSALLNYPFGVAVDSHGNLYIADSANNRIRKVSANGMITTVAGTGAAGFSGNGGLAVSAELNYPLGVSVDDQGNLFIVDTGNSSIRKVGPDGRITTVAGIGEYGFSGDGGPPTGARLGNPQGVAVDSQGTLFIADTDNSRVRKVGR